MHEIRKSTWKKDLPKAPCKTVIKPLNVHVSDYINIQVSTPKNLFVTVDHKFITGLRVLLKSKRIRA